MNFTSQMRYNPETGEHKKYYRLKEFYRDASGRACTRILLSVGFIHGLKAIAASLRFGRSKSVEHSHRSDNTQVAD